jgi:hypothetical protein
LSELVEFLSLSNPLELLLSSFLQPALPDRRYQ